MTKTEDNLCGVRQIKEENLMTKAVDNKIWSTVLVIRCCFLSCPHQKIFAHSFIHEILLPYFHSPQKVLVTVLVI